MSHQRSWSLSTLEPVVNFANHNTKQSMPTSTCVCSFFKLSMLRMWHVLAQGSKQRFFELNHCISSVHKEQYFGHWSSSSVLLVIMFSQLFPLLSSPACFLKFATVVAVIVVFHSTKCPSVRFYSTLSWSKTSPQILIPREKKKT